MTRIIRTPVGRQQGHVFILRHQGQAQAPQEFHPPTQQNDVKAEAEADIDLETQATPSQTLPQLPYPPQVLTSLTLINPKSKATTHIIPPAYGHAFHLPPGKSFRIVDLHGEQVVDLMAWTSPGDPSGQHTSMSYTRYNLGGSAPPVVGEHIYTNLGEKMLEMKADTVRCHDMLFMACNPSFYRAKGLQGKGGEGHRNCAENISGEVTRLMGEEGGGGGGGGGGRIGWNEIIDPFNVFQNTPYYSLKALGCSKAGDYCEFENVLGKDVVVGLSCCPFEGGGFNGGRVTEVAVVVEV